MQRLCQKLTIGRYASTGDRRSDLTYRHGSDFGAGMKRRENLRQMRDTELANDPDMRSETATKDFTRCHSVSGIREITEVLKMVKKAYQCGECGSIHDGHYQAERCCMPEPVDVWLCPICDECHEEESDAEKCCEKVVPGGEQVDCPRCLRGHETALHAVEVEVAGHCSVCDPKFTVDQNFQIQDRLDELKREHEYLIGR